MPDLRHKHVLYYRKLKTRNNKVVKKPKSLSSKTKALLVADFAADKKADKIVILDMRKVANFCDFFIVCSGSSDRRVKAITDGIIDGLEAKSVHIHHAEGREQATWIVIDLGDILVHIFEEKVRDFYNLEHLWQDAKRLKYQNKSAD